MSTPPLNHLILVCCHAIYLSGPHHAASESQWLLAPFQRGESTTFTAHIQRGLRILASDTASLLVFSGSKTRREVEKSEARGYWDLCVENGFWGLLKGEIEGGDERGRIVLEEQAFDSFANLQFSLAAFWRISGENWPETVTIISHGFKRARFMDLHIKALMFPRERVQYIGIDPDYMIPGNSAFDQQRAEDVKRGERERGYDAWEADLYGEGEVLRSKRKSRNFWNVGQELFDREEKKKTSGWGIGWGFQSH